MSVDAISFHRSPASSTTRAAAVANYQTNKFAMGPIATGVNSGPMRPSGMRPISGEQQHSNRRSSEANNSGASQNLGNTGTYLPPIKNSHLTSTVSSNNANQYHHYLSQKNSFPNYYQPPQSASGPMAAAAAANMASATGGGGGLTAHNLNYNHSILDNHHQSTVAGGGTGSYPVVQPLYGSQDHSFWQSKKDLSSMSGLPNSQQQVTVSKSEYSTTSLPRSRERESSNRTLERRPSNQSNASSRQLLGKDSRVSPGGALTVDSAMKQYMHKLSDFEHREIYSYSKVYFCGPNAKKRPGIIGGNQNCGFDDENGCYIPVPHDHVAYRYELLKVIGKGSFGQVLKCYDHKTQTHVALKMVRNEKRFHRQAQEEIRILEHLKRQDINNNHNIVHIVESFEFRNHQCITFELLSMNLYELIKKNKFHGFTLQLVRKFAHSLLQCLECLHRNKIIHCDLKPENILLKQQGRSGIKVIDFGSSCYEHQRIYTYIQSRFYRAPEVILG